MKRLIVDIDNTISFKKSDEGYEEAKPDFMIRDQLNSYHDMGFEIVFFTSRNMRTFNNNIGKINIYTLPGILRFLDQFGFKYTEVIVGKPWCGTEGFYVDDRAIRPSEFKELTYEQIMEVIRNEVNTI